MALEELTIAPDQDGYLVGPDNSVVSTQHDGGYSRSRSDLVNAASIVDVIWEVNQGLYQQLKAFYNFYGAKGAKPFLIRLVLDQPFTEIYEAKFVANSMQTTAIQGLTLTITAQLEVIVPNDPLLDELIWLIGLEGNGYLNYLQQLANYDLEIPAKVIPPGIGVLAIGTTFVVG